MIRTVAWFTLFLVGCAAPAIAPTERLAPFPRVTESNDGTYLVGVDRADALPFDTPFSLFFAIEPTDGDRGVLDDLTIAVDCSMPQHGHGMNVVPGVERTAPGRFTVRGFELFMEGEWLLTVDITSGIYTERTQWWVEPQ